jgi:hypothetical protein
VDMAVAEPCPSGGYGVAECVYPAVDFLFARVYDEHGGWRGHREHVDHIGEVREQAVVYGWKVGCHREARDRDLIELLHRYLSAAGATGRWLMVSRAGRAAACVSPAPRPCARKRARTRNSVSNAIATTSDVIVSTITNR